MTRDEQLIKAALEMAAGMIEDSAKDAMEAADTSDMGSIVATWLNDEAEAIRSIDPSEVLEKVRDDYCTKCGHPRSNHPYRHPFVGMGTNTPQRR